MVCLYQVSFDSFAYLMKVRLLPDFTYEIADIQIGGAVAMEGTLAVHRNYYPHRKYYLQRH